MRPFLISFLFSTIFLPRGAGQGPDDIGYIVSLNGDWRDANTNRVLRPLSLLQSRAEIKLVSQPHDAGMIRIRFLQDLCDKPLKCSDAVPCGSAISVDALFSRRDETCRAKESSWTGALVAGWKAFFQKQQSGEAVLAITMSRGADGSDEEGTGPSLQEAVLLVDGGRIDLAPLFRAATNGSFSLQFCDPGPALAGNCGASTEKERLPVRIVNQKPDSVEFPEPEGLYRVRLWHPTPKGIQPTEKTAVVLAGPKAKYQETQRAFLQISASASDRSPTDPMIRLMLSAWLANAKRNAL